MSNLCSVQERRESLCLCVEREKDCFHPALYTHGRKLVLSQYRFFLQNCTLKDLWCNYGLCCFMSCLPCLYLGTAATTARSFDLVKLAQECCYHNNRGIAAHGVRILTNISASCQEKGKRKQGQGNVSVYSQAYALNTY